ncbi:PIN-like domain-containing protein [Achromobacter aloeverae]
MRKLFPGHYPPNLPFKDILDDAVFIFDTNVLINLYRLGTASQAKLFEGLAKIADRCWLPYHVAQEFQDQRQGRIEDALAAHDSAVSKISDLKNIVTQVCAQHDVLKHDPDTEDHIAALTKAVDQLVEHAKKSRSTLPQRSNGDPIAEQLADIFDGRVGSPPAQEEVDAINAEGEERFKFKLPPGHSDEKKNEQPFRHGDVVYQQKYGDLYIWKQTLKYIKTLKGRRHLVFVTDEKKSDWWAKKGGGPDVRLAQELASEANGWSLWMYSSERFFQRLGIALELNIEKQTLEELKHAAQEPVDELPEWLELIPESATYTAEIEDLYADWVMELNPICDALNIQQSHHGSILVAERSQAAAKDPAEPHLGDYGRYIVWNWGTPTPMNFAAACRFARHAPRKNAIPTTLVLNVTGVSDSALNGLLFSASHSTMPEDSHGAPISLIIATCELEPGFIRVIYTDGDRISGLEPKLSHHDHHGRYFGTSHRRTR